MGNIVLIFLHIPQAKNTPIGLRKNSNFTQTFKDMSYHYFSSNIKKIVALSSKLKPKQDSHGRNNIYITTTGTTKLRSIMCHKTLIFKIMKRQAMEITRCQLLIQQFIFFFP